MTRATRRPRARRAPLPLLRIAEPAVYAQIDFDKCEAIGISRARLEQATLGSHLPVWWTHVAECGCVHSWQKAITARRIWAKGCKQCLLKDCVHSSMAFLRPDIFTDWSPQPEAQPAEPWSLCGWLRCEGSSHDHP